MARLGNLVPLLILFIFLAIGAFIGYQIYTWSNELTARGKKKMEKKNISMTKEGGIRVGVKEMNDSEYADKMQKGFVKTWNNASLPNYKSRLGWNSSQQLDDGAAKKAPSPSVSRTTSSTANATAKLSPAAARPNVQRTPSTPGSWE